jgi:hypothetical protein
VIQKLVMVATSDMLRQLADIVKQNFVQMSINAYGCFVVQAMLNQDNISITQVHINMVSEHAQRLIILCYIGIVCIVVEPHNFYAAPAPASFKCLIV